MISKYDVTDSSPVYCFRPLLWLQMSLRHLNVAGKLSFVDYIRLGKPKEKPSPNSLRMCLPRKYLSEKFPNQREMDNTLKTDLPNESERFQSRLLLYCNRHKFQMVFLIGIPDCLRTLKKTCTARRFSDVFWLVFKIVLFQV